MDADRSRSAFKVFEDAIELDQDDRAAFLEKACRGDAQLCADVEAMLASDRASEKLLGKPIAQVSPACDDDYVARLVGTEIGGYLIEDVIATGGMGVVYRASQKKPNRHVALKVMRRGIASRSALRRFHYEVEILGRLRHPGIAQVYEAGLHDDGSGGVPYFAMEYIPDARHILAYADEKQLGTKERLRLFADVCDAVNHGHQKGIIHRDLKPANILVDTSGQPKVIDFGVARATDSDLAVTTQRTDVGELIGTLQYMSPEQCEGDPGALDIRSDVYSLGVILFELVCGRLPYDLHGRSLPSATRIIQDQDPQRPSAIMRPLRGDVEAIILKALAKDRDKRYQSAAELGRDIRRHLAGEPIDARPPTVWTPAVRWAHRHPLLTTTAACLTVILLTFVATTVSIWYLNTRPQRIDISADRRVARVLSLAGATLHTWKSEDFNSVSFARIVQRPPEQGGGRLAILACAKCDVPDARSLLAFDVDGDLGIATWRGSITDEELPDALVRDGFMATQFVVRWAGLADVFDPPIGPEIIAIFQSHRGECAVRIYDLRGKALYGFWHDGNLNNAYWMSDERLLVFGGLNAEGFWHERGFTDMRSSYHPPAIFAIRPVLGEVDHWVRAAGDPEGLGLAWYRTLLPPSVADSFASLLVGSPRDRVDGGRFVGLVVRLRALQEVTLGAIVDHEGNEDPSMRWLSNPYAAARNVPPIDSFRLAPMPPLVLATKDDVVPPPGGATSPLQGTPARSVLQSFRDSAPPR